MKRIFLMFLLACLIVFGAGCSKESENRLQDLEFTVVPDGEIPAELKAAIDERKQNDFKLTYSAEQYLYLVVGYGAQSSGGYSIQVKELYLTDSNIVLDTELLGPEDTVESGSEASYPYIVLKLPMREEPVVFR
ncbi:protease complex subunit PrcB family protein [Hominifimenecus sp. rT4P-3]|uniref:protease complex subunit PrcB family protein n=1 Tax=Hominifimenecus sp. rT4P-3 TaxID=3242979 RepID=UPI003DA275E5